MSIDIGALFGNMAKSAGDALGEGGEAVGKEMQAILEGNKQAISELLEAKVKGEITDEIFEQELAREKSVLEAQLIGLEIQAKAAIQKAVNAAMDTLKQTVSAAL